VYTNFTDTPGHNRVDLALFGWSPSYPLVNYPVNPVFRLGTPALLDLITSLGSVFLKADNTAASLEVPLTNSSYMSFSPLGSVYHSQQHPGSYVSMTSSLQSYKYYFDLLQRVQPAHKTYLLLAIIYDFMAFTAQLYSRMLGRCRINLTNMTAIRTTLHSQLHCILSAEMTNEYIEFISVLKVIALTSMPLPRTPDGSHTSPVPSRHRQREPDSAALQKLESTDPVLKKPRVERLHSIVFPLVYAEVPAPLQKPSIDLRSPEPTPIRAARTGGEESTSDDSEPESKLNFFSTVSLNAISTTATKFVMDSGAGKCGV
jgi:hypothetical protein